jgi:DNA-binding transcriptional LysR family regulator
MNLEQLRTFLEVAGCGNFSRAAENLNLTQSTVSARISALEQAVGSPLFVRAHSGATLTAAGQRLRAYALSLHRLWQQARQAVSLPPGFRATFGLGAQVSLWEDLILKWIPWMRNSAPDVALRVEADYSASQLRQLVDGLLDVGVMYQPRRIPGLVVEELLRETLVLVSTEPRAAESGWLEDYVFVDWGEIFRSFHAQAFPEMGTPAISVGLGALGLQHILHCGGSGYFPMRVVRPLVASGRLHRVAGAPVAYRPAYMVYAAKPKDADLLAHAAQGLKTIAAETEEGQA